MLTADGCRQRRQRLLDRLAASKFPEIDPLVFADPIHLMYLANFYRYGMGTNQDRNQGYMLMQSVLRMPDGLDVYARVQGTTLSGVEMLGAAAGLLSALKDEQACDDANAMRRPQATVGGAARNCNQTEDWFLRSMKRPALHTVDHPEEIWLEVFDPVVLPELTDLKERSAAGLVRLTM